MRDLSFGRRQGASLRFDAVSELVGNPLNGAVLAAGQAVSESGQTMSAFLHDYFTVAIFGAIAIGLLGGVLGLGSLIRPKREKGYDFISYESGVDPVGDGWAQSPIRYYVFALLFVLFDVEAVFIFPWATRLEAYGWFGAIEMIVFIVVLALGLLYAWRKDVLRWI